MGLFGKTRFEREMEKFDRRRAERRVEYQMVKNGWRVWRPGAAEEERLAALEAYVGGEHVEWYPPGYQGPEPLDVSGKLVVDPDPVEEVPRRRFFGLF